MPLIKTPTTSLMLEKEGGQYATMKANEQVKELRAFLLHLNLAVQSPFRKPTQERLTKFQNVLGNSTA